VIVQTAPEGVAQRFVIRQVDHARASGMLAEAFGNALFEMPEPRELLTYLVAHHDEGWEPVDADAERDPDTQLPYHLVRTPTRLLLRTGPGAPTFNSQRHPLCGLITSMHTWGLYHGRYGLSDMVFIDRIAPDLRPQVEAMLDHELARQDQLRAQLPEALQAQPFAFWLYKLLQFFDTLALYVQTTHAAALKPTAFKHVPVSIDIDTTIEAIPLSADTVRLTPYPFAIDGLSISTHGRYLSPLPPETSVAGAMQAAPVVTQTFRMVA
jgi:Protein of unknown function (DUF3891)